MTNDRGVAGLVSDPSSLTSAAIQAIATGGNAFVRIPATELNIVAGSITPGGANSAFGWVMPDGFSALAGSPKIPASWDHIDVAVMFYKTTGSGNVRWEFSNAYWAETGGNSGSTNAGTVTAGVDGNVVTGTIVSNLDVGSWNPGTIPQFAVRRIGGDALDTLAADVTLVGVKITKR